MALNQENQINPIIFSIKTTDIFNKVISTNTDSKHQPAADEKAVDHKEYKPELMEYWPELKINDPANLPAADEKDACPNETKPQLTEGDSGIKKSDPANLPAADGKDASPNETKPQLMEGDPGIKKSDPANLPAADEKAADSKENKPQLIKESPNIKRNNLKSISIKPFCWKKDNSKRLNARHLESKGIGYNQGYTTAEFFIAKDPFNKSCVPFFDGRLHIFNDGNLAANAGLGLRFLGSCHVYGLNGYYDWRKTGKAHYNQISIGGEVLGKIWDVRINGYLPIGKTSGNASSYKFSHFQENYMVFSRKRQDAMKGLNAEIGCHFKKIKKCNLYGALGPYYFSKNNRRAIGGKARLFAKINDHLMLEANGSYDAIFKWIGQGQIGFSFSLSPKKRVKQKKCCRGCRQILYKRAIQSVDRDEIIVINLYKQKSKSLEVSAPEQHLIPVSIKLERYRQDQFPFTTKAGKAMSLGMG